MKTYTLNIAGLKRELPIIKLSYDLSIASFVILGDTEIVRKTAPMIAKKLPDVDFIITAEEHSVIGGLGSAVSEFLSETHPTLIKKLGVYDKFGQSGKGAEMLEKYELTAAKLVSMVKENLK